MIDRTLRGPAVAGLNRVVWDLADGERKPVGAGGYTITLEAAGRTLRRTAVVR